MAIKSHNFCEHMSFARASVVDPEGSASFW
jgi:hypothetical protein